MDDKDFIRGVVIYIQKVGRHKLTSYTVPVRRKEYGNQKENIQFFDSSKEAPEESSDFSIAKPSSISSASTTNIGVDGRRSDLSNKELGRKQRDRSKIT